MILAPTLTLNTLARGYDADATAFAAASGATDVAALSAFVKGVKELGLWSNMVCWPLRSSQNAGTGTTAFSLGGLGTYNGTLVSGPTWEADGIAFVAANSTHITTTLDVQNLRQFTVMAAADQATNVNNDCIVSAWGAATTSNYFLLRKPAISNVNAFVRSSGANRQVSGFSASGASGDMRVYGWGTQDVNTVLTVSGVSVATQAFLPDETGSQTINIGILTPPSNAPYNGKIGWVFFIKDAELTTAQQLSVYTLYKTTLGTGLGLP